MSRKVTLPAWALLAGLLAGLLLAPAPARAETVVVPATTRDVPLGKKLEVLEDKSGRWTLQEVRSAPLSEKFVRSTERVPNYGFTRSVYWFRFRLQNPGKRATEWLLEVGYPMLDRLELWVQRSDGTYGKPEVGGDRLPFGARKIKHRNFVFPLHLEAGRPHWVYLRIKTESSMQVPITLWSKTAFLAKDHEEQAALWGFYGIMFVMALYNLFVFLSIRDRAYAFYVAYIIAAALFQMSLNGLAYEYLWPSAVWWGNIATPFLLGMSTLFACQFSRDFLATRREMPRGDKVFLGLMGLAAIGSLVALVGPYRPAIQMTVGGVIIATITIMISAAIAMRHGFRPARYMLLAWGVLCVGVVMAALKAFGVLPHTFITNYGNNFGTALEVVLLSFALADRINVLKAETTRAQERALQSERHSLEVEREAKERLQEETDRQTEALRDANQRLQELDRQKTMFFQNISHELRSPLTVILNPVERLLASGFEGPPELGLRDKLLAMERNTHRLLRLVNQLLDFSRLESGRTTISYEKRDLEELLRPILESFGTFAVAKELTLELRASSKLPEVYVDPEKLDTVVCNLLSNACKFTEAGGTVLVRVETEGDRVTIAVKDNGVGIPEDQLPRVFERFHRVDGASSKHAQGTGIGLALAKELVELTGGRLRVQSEIGFGSTFTVELPTGDAHVKDQSLIRAHERATHQDPDSSAHIALAEIAALAAEIGTGERSGDGQADALAALLDPATPVDPDRPLVLVVEDNPDMLDLVTDICHEHFQVLTAVDGEEAVTALDALPDERLPALVISDVMMPGMDGHELLTRLRTTPRTASIPVMLLTAKAGPQKRIEGLESGADEYLTKPFDTRELSARARNLVRLKQQEQQLTRLNQRLEQLNTDLTDEVTRQTAAAERARELGRYLPRDVVESILDEGGDAARALAHERRRLTLFRVELRGFGALTDVLEPEDLAELLDSYLSTVLTLSAEHGATVEHVALDRVSGFFGAPRSQGEEQDARACAAMVLAMYEQALELTTGWRSRLNRAPPKPAAVMHSGYATVGNFGAQDRLEYTGVGAVVREADALLRIAHPGVLCTQATWTLVGEALEGDECGAAALRSHAEPVQLHRLAGSGPTYSPRSPSRQTPAATTLEPTTTAGPLGDLWASGELYEGLVVADRYETLEALGVGGMGSVFRARDNKLDIDVALKLLRFDQAIDAQRIKRLRKEVLLSRRISHRNIARIYDIGEWQGGEFISMEFLGGETLAERIDSQGPLPEEAIVKILAQVCAGLKAAHEAEVIHRDLKPSNVMLEPDGRAVICDFGIARAFAAADNTRSETREFLGTPHYMAPEQVRGDTVDPRTDLYSLGALAYEMATGKTVFESDTVMSLAFKHVTAKPPNPRELRPDLSPKLEALILRCLEKKPAKRYGSADEILTALDAA